MLDWTGFVGKTLWDWLQLLIIPLVLVVGGWALNRSSQRQIENREKWSQHHQDLQLYMTNISEMLLNKNLLGSSEQGSVRAIARYQTQVIMPRIDGEEKGILLRFLKEAGLINNHEPIINLRGSDLHYTKVFYRHLPRREFRNVSFAGAFLNEADFSELDLTGVDFTDADLAMANFKNAKVTLEQLEKAHSLSGTIMSNGERHLQ